jgi:hypothetical protein
VFDQLEQVVLMHALTLYEYVVPLVSPPSTADVTFGPTVHVLGGDIRRISNPVSFDELSTQVSVMLPLLLAAFRRVGAVGVVVDADVVAVAAFV